MSLFKKIEQENFETRAKKFFKKYQILSRKYGCDFQAYMSKKTKEKPSSPKIAIVDIIELIKKEKVTQGEVKKPAKPFPGGFDGAK